MTKPVPEFVPRKGQTDFTNIRWCPVINCVVFYADTILLVKRNENMRLYPGYWNGISGFLDDQKSLEEKVTEELTEEIGITKDHIMDIELKGIFDQEDASISKTWVVHAVKVVINTSKIALDWEATEYVWTNPTKAKDYKLIPGFDEVLEATLK